MRERRLTFGEVAEAYDRARPSYPAALVEDVIALAATAGSARALEVGAGTGKATVLFARRGVPVLALEPSGEMAAVARRNCAGHPDVRIEQVEFERWEPAGERFTLLYAAQAWHWVRPEERYGRARAALVDDGLLAPFWNRVDWEACELRKALVAAYDRAGSEPASGDPMDPRHLLHADPSGAWEREIHGAAGFGEPEYRGYPWAREYSAPEYVQLLATHSIQLVREPSEREALLSAVAEAVEAHGGSIRIPYVTQLCLGRAV